MGLFDTVHFPEPLHVPGWSEPLTETQTKLFANAMLNYSVGSVLPETPVLIGVVEDFLWCSPEEGEEKGKEHPVFYVVWHRILAGVYLDAEAAQQRLREVDRLDLIEWWTQHKTMPEHGSADTVGFCPTSKHCTSTRKISKLVRTK